MAILAVAGGETGVVGDEVTTGGTGATVQSAVALDGTYSYKNAQTTTQQSTHVIQGYAGDGTQGNTSYSVSTAYHNMDFRVDTLPGSGDEPILRARAGTATKLTLAITSTGLLNLYDKDTSLVATSSTALSTGTTYNIGLKAGNGTSAAYEVQINGVSELSGTCNQNATNVQNFIAGKSSNFSSQSIVYYHDNHITSDSGFNPTAKLAFFVATANGSTMQWTGGTGASDYTQINPIPRTNSTYVANTGTANQVALFTHGTMASLGLSGATIIAASPGAFVRDQTGSDATNTKMRFKSGATTTDTLGADTGTGGTWLGQIFNTDPNTGATWTETNLNATEFGATDTTTNIIRMTGAFMYVVYTPLLTINKSESITITESIGRLLTSRVNVSDSITISESVAVSISGGVTTLSVNVSDTITITENVQLLEESNINTSDSITITENTSLLIPDLYINTTDSVTVSENLQLMEESYINKSDSITVTDTPTVLRIEPDLGVLITDGIQQKSGPVVI